MCTCSWMNSDCGYELWFNRDEQKTRPPGKPPEQFTTDKGSYISPIDPVAAGTWIFSNNHGLSACLLNYYDAPTKYLPEAERSRGLLLKALAYASDLENFETLLTKELKSYQFAPCRLVAVDPKAGTRLWSWNGASLEDLGLQKQIGMITSSSWNATEVIAVRERSFSSLVPARPESNDFSKFHFSTLEEGSEYSVCMDRSDTRTVSFSRITCQPHRTIFTYQNREENGGFSSPKKVELTTQA